VPVPPLPGVELADQPKFFGNMMARDGVERFRTQCFQQLGDSTKDRKDTEDRKDSSCVRFVCEFLPPESAPAEHTAVTR
jgi:hypothetical protein